MPHKSTDRKGSDTEKQSVTRLAVKDALREVSFGLQKHPVIHKSDFTGLARIPQPLDEDRDILQAQPD